MRNVQPAGQQIAELQIQLHELLLIEKRYHLLNEVISENSLQNAMIKLEKATVLLPFKFTMVVVLKFNGKTLY